MIGRVLTMLIGVCTLTLAGCAQKTAHTSTAAKASAPLAAVSAAPVMGDPSHGSQVFRANCSACHSIDGSSGGVGPSLQHEKLRKNYEQTVAWIESPDPPMPKLYPATLAEKDVQDVAAYVESL